MAVGLPTIVETTLHAFLAGVRERFGPRVAEIRLFGSYARGDATEDSDVDCLILLDRVDENDDRAITSLAADLTWQIAGVVVLDEGCFILGPSVAEFEAWKALDRRTALEIEREGIPL